MAMEPLGKLIRTQIAAKGDVAGPIASARIVAAVAEELAASFPALARRLHVVSYRDGIVTVAALSGAAAAELRLREPQLLAKLRARLGAAVRALRYSVGARYDGGA
jgi:predicted nucleic acid-binding Zn ribbon protein